MSYPGVSEAQLIQQAARGDEEAFTTLFHQHFQAVYNYAVWLCNDMAQAEDLTQEAFIKAHSNLKRFGPPWKFRAWLYRVTRNLLIDQKRRERPVEPLEPDMPLSSPEPDPERTLLTGEMAARVRSALQHLPDNYREALVLREFDGLAYADIALIMDVTVSNLKSLIHRARARFKEVYGLRILAEDALVPCTVLNELLDVLHDGESLADQDRMVREHLAECPTCQQRQRELVALTALFVGLPPVVPPLDLAPRILEQTVGAKRVARLRRGRVGPRAAVRPWMIVAAGGGLLAGGLALIGLLWALTQGPLGGGRGGGRDEPTPMPSVCSAGTTCAGLTSGSTCTTPDGLAGICRDCACVPVTCPEGPFECASNASCEDANGPYSYCDADTCTCSSCPADSDNCRTDDECQTLLDDPEAYCHPDLCACSPTCAEDSPCFGLPPGYTCTMDSGDTGSCQNCECVPDLATCGNGIIEEGEACEAEEDCAQGFFCGDPGTGAPCQCLPLCGDGVCASFESPESCPADCGQGGQESLPGADGSLCGDGICQAGESPGWCGDCVQGDSGGDQGDDGSGGDDGNGQSPPPQGPVCGNGSVETGEQCDPPGSSCFIENEGAGQCAADCSCQPPF